MYLDNMMSKKYQTAFYAFIAVVGMTIFIGATILWVVPRDHKDDLLAFPEWSFLGFGPGLAGKFAAVSGALGMIGGAYSVWALQTNKLAIKKHANLFQIAALVFIIIAIICATYDALDKFKGRKEDWDWWQIQKSEHIVNPNPTAEALALRQRDLLMGVSYKLYIASYIEIVGASLSIIPICMFFGKSSFLWH